MGTTEFDRRVGRRVQVDPREIGWRVTPPGEKAKRRFGLVTAPTQTARLLELSVSGAQVRAPAAKDLQRGQKIWIEIEGVVGEVKIRRMIREPGAGSRASDCLYGLELGPESTSELTKHVHRMLDREFGTYAYQWHGSGWG